MKTNNIKPIIYGQDTPSLGWRTAEDQEKLYQQHLIVLGAGGAGGGVAEAAARDGMSVTVADPDVFDTTNLNRQTGAYVDTVGKNKAATIAALMKRIRPDSDRFHVYEEGITIDNMAEVLQLGTLVLDAIDISRPDLSIAVSRHARSLRIPVFMGIEIGMGAAITCFDPDESEYTVEHFYGIEPDTEVTKETDIPLMNTLIHMPSYTPPGMLESFMNGELPSTPGISAGVQILSGAMLTTIERYVLGYKAQQPKFVYPNMYVFDPVDGMFTVHAEDRGAHLSASIEVIGSNMQSSGFSLPADYDTM
jgi:molybdopterin/thiamine biosynthesis adenylyltransferase